MKNVPSCSTVVDDRGRELISHGTTDFPLGYYRDNSAELAVPWHWHDEFECTIVLEGILELCVDGTKLFLYPGDGIFINSGVLHSAELSTGPSAAITLSLVFHPRLVGGSMDSIFWQQLVQPLLKNTAFHYLVLHPAILWQNEIIQDIRDTWDAVSGHSEDYENFARYRLSRALRLLNQNCPSILKKSSAQDVTASERIKNMLLFIDEHYNEELTVRQISGSASVSESVCLRTFRYFLGTTPIQYVLQLRLNKAADLLGSTDLKISEIAMECGFSDMSYFTRSFRKWKGCTPGDYRMSR